MRYKPEQKQQTRERIISAASRTFKSKGYNGVGIDALAKEAGVTSGAFYGHFKAKEEAFKQTLLSGLNELNSAIGAQKQASGEQWWNEFSQFYLTQKRTCDLSESCALQSLSSEVARSSDSTRELFQQELLKIVELASDDHKHAQAWASLAMLIGGVTLARAVVDPELSDEIANAIMDKMPLR